MYQHQYQSHYGRAIGCLTIAVGAFFGISSAATAIPESPLTIAQVRSRAIAPTPLNVTPLPGRHIPLPRGSSSYRDYRYHNYDYRDRFHHRYRRRDRNSRGDTTIIIINPSHGGYSDYRRDSRVKILRP